MVGDAGLEPATPCMSSKDAIDANTLALNGLRDSVGAVSTQASTHSTNDVRANGSEATPPAPDAKIMLEAIRGMSDAERGKLLMALLGLADENM